VRIIKNTTTEEKEESRRIALRLEQSPFRDRSVCTWKVDLSDLDGKKIVVN
jgi:hypothetical protein